MQFKQIRESGDRNGMKRLLAISLLSCLLISNGCMVIDELDSAAALMPDKKTESEEAAKTEVVAKAVVSKESVLFQKTKRWWKRAMAPAPVETEIVTCRFPEGTRFMSREGCLSQGGKPGKA